MVKIPLKLRTHHQPTEVSQSPSRPVAKRHQGTIGWVAGHAATGPPDPPSRGSAPHPPQSRLGSVAGRGSDPLLNKRSVADPKGAKKHEWW